MSDAGYFYLCGACGAIAEEPEWTYWNVDDDDGELVPAPLGDEPTYVRCPTCGHDHVDDDANPGLYDGTRADVEAERAALAADPVWTELWIERLSDLIGPERSEGPSLAPRERGHRGNTPARSGFPVVLAGESTAVLTPSAGGGGRGVEGYERRRTASPSPATAGPDEGTAFPGDDGRVGA